MMNKGKKSKGKPFGIMVAISTTPMGKAYGKAKKQMKKGKKK